MSDSVVLERIASALERIAVVLEAQHAVYTSPEMDALFEALGAPDAVEEPSSDSEPAIDLMEQHFRYRDGSYGIREASGMNREATDQESRQIQSLLEAVKQKRR